MSIVSLVRTNSNNIGRHNPATTGPQICVDTYKQALNGVAPFKSVT